MRTQTISKRTAAPCDLWARNKFGEASNPLPVYTTHSIDGGGFKIPAAALSNIFCSKGLLLLVRQKEAQSLQSCCILDQLDLRLNGKLSMPTFSRWNYFTQNLYLQAELRYSECFHHPVALFPHRSKGKTWLTLKPKSSFLLAPNRGNVIFWKHKSQIQRQFFPKLLKQKVWLNEQQQKKIDLWGPK